MNQTAIRSCLRAGLLAILVAVSAFAAAQSKATASPAAWSVRSRPSVLVNGSPVLFTVTPPTRLKSLSGTWLDHSLSFDFDPASKTWYTLAGVSLKTRPGHYSINLEAQTQKGTPLAFERKFSVRRGKYKSAAISVPKQYTEPDPAQLQKINEDKALKDAVFQQSAPVREWSGRFLQPVTAPVTAEFGTQRKFNGVVQSVHEGLDFGVPAGTAVSALNRGTVILARPLFFEGNCVILDHGEGLLTLYLHLSELKVKEGDQVAKGQNLGLSGATGRATGAHLHVAVRWQGVYLNPATLMSLPLP